MKISPGVQESGLQGIRNSVKQLQQAADKIAGHTTGATQNPADLTKSVIDLKQAEIRGEAAVKVLEAQTDMLGSLLDTQA